MCVRDKVGHVRHTAQRLLAQTYEPLTVIFSDHWSTDGTWELLRDIKETYDGPHEVVVQRCPHSDRVGILGLNAHMDWAVRRCERDVIFFSSADDVQRPERVERVMRVYDEYPELEYVATLCLHRTPDGEEQPSSLLKTTRSGLVDLKTQVVAQVGMQTGGAWRRDLWLRVGPMRGIEAPDLILPSIAALEGKMYILAEVLHDSVHVPDPMGVSTERAMQAAVDTDDFLPLVEVNHYQFTSSHMSLVRRIAEAKVKLDDETATALMQKLVAATDQWVHWRDKLTMGRRQPMAMRV